MSEVTTTDRMKWIYFFISLIVIIIMLAMPALRPWFWTALPFVCTTFVKAMKLM